MHDPGEILHGLELAVDAGEADIGNGVKGLEFAHDALADGARGNFVFEFLKEVALDVLHGVTKKIDRDRPLAAGDEHGAETFVARKLFSRAAPLYNKKTRPFRTFKRSESSPAAETFATPANRISLPRRSRVQNFLVYKSAKRAAHIFPTILNI